jgi:hypothetical protein
MADDEFRVEVDLDDEAHGHPFSERLSSLDLDDDVADRLGDRVIVTRDGARMFVYTPTRESAAEAERVVTETLTEDGLSAEVRITRWNPADRVWQDADAPLTATSSEPHDDAAKAAEEGVPTPLFVYVEGHEPRFLRDLGV